MKAIELKSKTDKTGRLKIDYKLDKSERNVRVLILIEEDLSTEEEEKLWAYSISRNPAFDFLKDPDEDVYTLKDGKPLDD